MGTLGGGGARGAAAPSAAVYVAAFGKHPGWNDHIDDLGLETDRLVAVKRILYLEGIGATIDSGAWEKLHESQRLEGFNHILVWRTPEDVVIAQLWSSRDGKGRTKYPMVVCAQVRGVPAPTALERVLPVLDRLRIACQQTTSAETVRSLLDGVRAELRSILLGPGGGAASSEEITVPADAISAMAAQPCFQPAGEPGGAAGEGLMRILYQIEREMAAYLAPAGGGGKSRLGTALSAGRSRLVDARPQQIRVPACGSAPGEVALRWLRFLLALLDPHSTMVLVIPLRTEGGGLGEWADVLVGEPVGSQFFCIRATPKALPLTSDIPYSLDPQFVASASKQLGSPLAEGAFVVQRSSGGSRPAPVPAAGGTRSRVALLGIGGLVLVVTAVVVALVVLSPESAEPAGGPRPRAEAATPAPPADTPAQPRQQAPANGRASTAGPADAPAPEASDTESWETLCTLYRDWVGLFVRELTDARRARLGADPELAQALACFGIGAAPGAMTLADPWMIAGVDRSQSLSSLLRSPPAAARSQAGQQRTGESLDCIRGLERALSPQGWPRLAALSSTATRFADRGWTAAAEAAQRAAAQVHITRGVDLAALLDSTLATMELVERIEARWERINAAAGPMQSTGDAVLARFADWPGRLAQEAMTTADPLGQLEERLAQVEQVATQVTAFISAGGGWEGIDHEAFAAGSAVHRQVAAGRAVDGGVVRDWLYQAGSFAAIDVELDPRRQWSQSGQQRLPAGVSGLEELVAQLGAKAAPQEAQQAQEQLRRLMEQAGELSALRWSAGSRAAIESGAARLDTEIGEMRRSLQRRLIALSEEAARSLAEAADRLRARPEVTASSALNSAWRRGRDALIDELSGHAGGGDPAGLLQRAGELERALLDLEEAVPGLRSLEEAIAGLAAPAGPWISAVRAEAAAARERVLAAATSGADWAEAAPQARLDFESALNTFSQLVRSAAAAERLLDLAHDFTESPAGGGLTLGELAEQVHRAAAGAGYNAPAAAEPVLARIAQLEQIAASVDRQELAAGVTRARADRPEQAVAAWRRLGNMPQRPWPADLAELRQEQALRDAVARVAAGVPDLPRREALAGEVGREGPVRWERAAAGLRRQDELEAALGLMAAMGVRTTEGISDHRTRLNAQLWSLRQHLGTADLEDAAALEAVQSFLAGAVKHNVEGSGRLLDELTSIAREAQARLAGQASGPPRVDPTRLGPGALPGWEAAEEAGGGAVVFRRSGGTELRFVLVDDPSAARGGGVYIQDRELSLGTFMDIVDAAGRWRDMAQLLPAFSTGDDPRLGPRAWTWAEARGDGVRGLRPADGWLRQPASLARAGDRVPSYYAPGHEPDPPSLQHPMQQLPPEAAIYAAHLAGCRLPTSAEWLAAYRATGSPAPGPEANLRDAAWTRQHANVVANRRAGRNAEWPDEGIFWPAAAAPDNGKRGRDAEAHQWDDSVLWFKPAAADADGHSIGNLIGNVAEYVLDNAGPIGALAAPEAESVRRYLRTHASGLAVIGGSALSPPSLPIEVAHRVDLDEAMELGYADVGFRLVLPMMGEGQVRRALRVEALEVLTRGGYVGAP